MVEMSSFRKHLFFLMLVLAYFFTFFFRISASVVMPMEAARLGMSAGVTGFIASLYFYSYALMQPLCGALSDRYGPMRVVSAGMALAGAGVCFVILSPGMTSLGMWRFLTGLGLAPMFSGAIVYLAAAFPGESYARYSGITMAMGNLGAVVSVAPLGYGIDHWGRGAVFSLLALLSFLLAVALFLCRNDDPVANLPAEARSAETGLWERLLGAFRSIALSSRLRSMVLIWSVTIASLFALQALWAVSWFRSAYGISVDVARNSATLVSLGVLAGSILAGWLSPRDHDCAVTGSCLLYAASWLALLLSMGLRLPLYLSASAGFLLGCTCGMSLVYFPTKLNDLVTPSERGVILGAMNMIIMFVVIVFQWGSGTMLNHFPLAERAGQYSSQGYLVTFGMIVVFLFLSLPALRLLTRGK